MDQTNLLTLGCIKTLDFYKLFADYQRLHKWEVDCKLIQRTFVTIFNTEHAFQFPTEICHPLFRAVPGMMMAVMSGYNGAIEQHKPIYRLEERIRHQYNSKHGKVSFPRNGKHRMILTAAAGLVWFCRHNRD